LAFARFLSYLKYYEKMPEQIIGFEIPKKFILLGPKINNKDTNKVNESLRIGFEKIWKQYQNDIELIVSWLKKYKDDIYFICSIIEKVTKIRWPYKSIYIIPGIRNWAGSFSNLIVFGVKPKNSIVPPDADHIWFGTMNLIIHELLHVNTDKVSTSKLKYGIDTIELATNLIARKVNDLYKIKTKIAIPYKKLSVQFADLGKHERLFERMLKKTESYIQLLIEVDQFLDNIKK